MSPEKPRKKKRENALVDEELADEARQEAAYAQRDGVGAGQAAQNQELHGHRGGGEKLAEERGERDGARTNKYVRVSQKRRPRQPEATKKEEI